MSKVKAVIVIYEDKMVSVHGKEAEKWDNHCTQLGVIGAVHNCNPFDIDPVQWVETLIPLPKD